MFSYWNSFAFHRAEHLHEADAEAFFGFLKGTIPDVRDRDDDKTGCFELLNMIVSTSGLDDYMKQLYSVVDLETDYNAPGGV